MYNWVICCIAEIKHNIVNQLHLNNFFLTLKNVDSKKIKKIGFEVKWYLDNK